MTSDAAMEKAMEIIGEWSNVLSDAEWDIASNIPERETLTDMIARALDSARSAVPDGWQLAVGERGNDMWLWLRGPSGSCSLKVPRFIEGQETVRGVLLREFRDALAAPPVSAPSVEAVVKAALASEKGE